MTSGTYTHETSWDFLKGRDIYYASTAECKQKMIRIALKLGIPKEEHSGYFGYVYISGAPVLLKMQHRNETTGMLTKYYLVGGSPLQTIEEGEEGEEGEV